MKDTKKRIIDFLNRTPIRPVLKYRYEYFYYKKLRDNFWERSEDEGDKLAFYSKFIGKNDTVFDVGANFGDRTKIFSKLAMKVVAVEPQEECTKFLNSVFKKHDNIFIVNKALGAKKGQAEMSISNACTISSLSDGWIKAVQESGRFSNYNWDKKVIVPVDTLDNLIEEYGCPGFIKIDVEGFEDQVLLGLSRPVGGLSLEFTYEFMESTFRCIRHLSTISKWKFQIDLGESMSFHLPDWVGSEEILDELRKLPRGARGDLYAISLGHC